MVNCENKYSYKQSFLKVFFSVQRNWIYTVRLYYYREEMRCKFEIILRVILIPNKIYLKEHGTFITQLFYFSMLKQLVFNYEEVLIYIMENTLSKGIIKIKFNFDKQA